MTDRDMTLSSPTWLFLIDDALLKCFGGWNRDWEATVLFRIIHESVRDAAVPFPMHNVPAPYEIGTRVIETDIHKIVIPRTGERVIRHGPFSELLSTVRAT